MTSVMPMTERRLLSRGAAAVALVILMAACGDDALVDTTATPTTVPAPATTTLAPDQVLASGIAAIGTRYRYRATVSVDGTVTTSVTGRLQDGIGLYQVTTGAVTAEYLIAPEGQFARESGGEWSALGSPAPIADPLVQLLAPIDIRVDDVGGSETVIVARYPAATLGFEVDGTVDVTISIDAGVLTGMSYTVPLAQGGTAVVVVAIEPDPDATPITLP